MTFTPSSDDEAATAITRLVDGTLSDAERREVEAWANATPDVSRAVSAQAHVKYALANEGPPTPQRLLDAVGARYGAAAVAERPAASKRRRSFGGILPPASGWAPVSTWRPAIGFGAVAAVAAAAVVAVFVLTSGSSNPSITSAARLAFVPANQPAPAVASSHYLDVSYGGVTFPNYAVLHTVATGKLTNHIGGRSALTVYYRLPGGKTMSYTVFSGQPVPRPRAARQVYYDGVPLHVYRTSDGLSVVTLVRHGRTCVLAAPTPEDTVLALAAEPVLVGQTGQTPGSAVSG